MATIAEDLGLLGITDYKVTTASLAPGSVSVTYAVRDSAQEFAAPRRLVAGNFSGTLWETCEQETAGGQHTVTYTYKDAIAVLDATPCCLTVDSLYPGRRATRRERALVPIRRVLEACARAASRAGVSLGYSGFDGKILGVFMGGSGSIWSCVLEALRWCPNARSVCRGNSVELYNGDRGCAPAIPMSAAALSDAGADGAAATASIDLAGQKAGVLAVGGLSVDLGELYAKYARKYDWERNRAVIVANALVCCPEASVEADGQVLRFAARTAGTEGNSIPLSFEVRGTHKEETQAGPVPGDSNADFKWCCIAAPPAGELTGLTLQCRSNASGRMPGEPCWLAVWEQGEDGAFACLGVSANAAAQAAGAACRWLFGGLALSGRPIRLCLLDAPAPAWNDSLWLCARCSAAADGSFFMGAAGKAAFLPEIAYSLLVDAPDAAPAIEPFSGGADPEAPAGPPPPVTYTHLVSRTVTTSADDSPPPVVAARGKYNFSIPAGADPFQAGAFVCFIPYDSADGAAAGGDDAKRLRQEEALPWQTVKGLRVPDNWERADGEGLNMRAKVGNGGHWQKFWQRFKAARILAKIAPGCLAFGQPVFEPMPVDEAYPPDEEEEELAGGASPAPLSPALVPDFGEKDGAPANYKEFDKSGLDRLYVLAKGSFPASAKAADNPRGLRFCHGTLKQFVWLESAYAGTAPKDEAAAFFEGVMTDALGKRRRYACLSLSAVFINRRSKKFQVGTCRLAPGDEDYDAGADAGASGDVLREQDYYSALLAFYKASRSLGGAEVEATYYGVQGYEPGETPLEAVFTAGFTAGNATWDAKSRTLSVSNSRRGILGVDDLLQRLQMGRQSRLSDMMNSACDPPPPEEGEEGAQQDYPMVSPSVSVSVETGANARRLEPFQIYVDEEGEHWINGGVLPSPAGLIRFEPASIESVWRAGREFYVRAKWVAARSAWEPKIVYFDPS